MTPFTSPFQLIDGRTTPLWADSYDRELKTVFGGAGVAETVAGKLKAELSPQDATELSRVRPRMRKLTIAISRAIMCVMNPAARANSLKPRLILQGGIALDPQFALAYARLAEAEQGHP